MIAKECNCCNEKAMYKQLKALWQLIIKYVYNTYTYYVYYSLETSLKSVEK